MRFIDGKHLHGNHGVATIMDNLVHYCGKRDMPAVVGVDKKCDISQYSHYKSIKFVYYLNSGFMRFFIDIPFYVKYYSCSSVLANYFTPLFLFRVPSGLRRLIFVHDVLYRDFPESFSFTYRTLRHFINLVMLPLADEIFTISEYSKKSIESHYAKAVNPRVVNLGQSFPKVAQCKKYKHEEYFIYVSRFEKRKNQIWLLNFFYEYFRSTNVKLFLVGFDVDGSKKSCVDFVKKHFKCEQKVKFLENVPKCDLIDLLTNAKAIIYPSLGEGFGLPVIEGLYLNKNTFFSDNTAMSEFSFARENMFSDATSLKYLLRQGSVYEHQYLRSIIDRD